MQRSLLATLAAAVSVVLFSCAVYAVVAATPAANAEKKAPDEKAVARARKTIGMLDDIYKRTVVLITDKYVNDVDDFAAGSAAVLLFEQISKGGTHQVRLLDASGQPHNPENVAKDAFEKEAIRQLKAGAKSHELVTEEKGQAVLRVVTPVPVVMAKCTMCHEHYKDVKEGEPIGAISYAIPID
jgi:hypothetical protein